MLHGMTCITTFDIQLSKRCSFSFKTNSPATEMLDILEDMQQCARIGPNPAGWLWPDLAQYGLLAKIEFNVCHIFIYLTMLTHTSRTSDYSEWSTGCYATCHRKLCMEHGNARDLHFQENDSRFKALRLWPNGHQFAYHISKYIFFKGNFFTTIYSI